MHSARFANRTCCRRPDVCSARLSSLVNLCDMPARSVRSVHRRRGASVTVSRASRTARARPARLRHSCCLLRARQPSGRSGSTSTLLTASTERPHPLLPSGKHRALCRRLASEYAVPVRQINLVFCKTQSTKRKRWKSKKEKKQEEQKKEHQQQEQE